MFPEFRKLGSFISNDKDGMRQMINSLQRGETIALMADQAMSSGTKLPFMGRICITPISAAKLATKYGVY